MFKVVLHSNSEDGANATDATLNMLGGKLDRNKEGKVVFDLEGNAIVTGENEDFLKFAIVRQGYVKSVV